MRGNIPNMDLNNKKNSLLCPLAGVHGGREKIVAVGNINIIILYMEDQQSLNAENILPET